MQRYNAKDRAQDLRLHLQISTPWDESRATSYSPRVDCQSARTLKCLQKVILYQGFSLWERWGRVVCYSKDTAITWAFISGRLGGAHCAALHRRSI